AHVERGEGPSRELSKQMHALQIQNPRNHPAWDDLPAERQQKLIEKWEGEKAALWRKIEECPRASYFSQSK
ncbi:hypothetical protein NX871_31340, partial [Burkholderia thailandensis]|uniref:hypothetical protein n=1 Tax=Burkholderia thailandensis TaxID=57975 RepID=UPI00217DBB68